MRQKLVIIGSGISGLSAAAYAARAGFDVEVFEKNAQPGGRARQFVTANGYAFDMGPSWYWMPDIMGKFFEDFGYTADEFYRLVPLDPQFDIVFAEKTFSVPRSNENLRKLFESTEAGAGSRFDDFMRAAQYKYKVSMGQFVEKPCHSWWEFVSPAIAKSAIKLDLLSNFRDYVSKYFRHPELRALMEFPVIFLGAAPQNIPAMYSLMNYGGYGLGTWYPMGGFYQLILAMKKVAENLGVKFHFNSPVEKMVVEAGHVRSIQVNGAEVACDAVISSADYHHSETLLDRVYRNYDEGYWQSRTFAPSCLIYYLGFKQRIPRLKHHTLFFEHDLDGHIENIYKDKKWPDAPLFYACCPSKTDPDVAPFGHENVFLLMPLATGVQDGEDVREQYFQEMIRRLERHTATENLLSLIDYKQSYCVSDFVQDYNAYQGNAYGLANTLKQTAVLKPAIRNKKLTNLFYTGQLTVPGPGVPPSIISGRIVAKEIDKLFAKDK